MLIRNAKLLSFLSEEGAPSLADVRVRGTLIEAIAPAGTLQKEQETLDLNGAVLMPGLIDAHVHLHMGKRSGHYDTADRVAAPSQWALDAYGYARWFLDNGYTTVRDVGDEQSLCAIAARNAVNEGTLPGPRILCSGMTIVPMTGGFAPYGFISAFYGTAEDVRRIAREQFFHGADFLKLYGTGSMLSEDSQPGRRIMLEDEIDAAVAVANLRGSYCACHCHGAEAIGVMIDHGVRTIEHASYITEESCRKLDGRTDCGIVPTIACSTPRALELEDETDLRYQLFVIRSAARDACIRSACEHYHILMGWGTDMPIGIMERYPYIEWQERAARLGCGNEELLKQATVNSAVLLGIDDLVGTVACGKCADLIVMEDDPSADIAAMYHRPLHVIRDGVLIR